MMPLGSKCSKKLQSYLFYHDKLFKYENKNSSGKILVKSTDTLFLYMLQITQIVLIRY